jgi:hypothetical protein
MFRKLHSNRDPRDTLLREFKKEFSVYFGKAESGIISLLRQYPKHAYGAMLALMLVSLVLSFTVFRYREPVVITDPGSAAVKKKSPPGMLSPVSGSFEQILQTTSTLRQTLELKQQIDTLLTKGALTREDSIKLATSLDQLQHLQQSLSHK